MVDSVLINGSSFPDMDQMPEFITSLRNSKLVADDVIDGLVATCGSDMDAMANMLFDGELLTGYQLERIILGETEGLVLGQYRILDELGRGGFGCVYKAHHVLMNRLAALKVIAPGLLAAPNIRSWFIREVQATTRLTHPNIVAAFDANEVGGVVYLAMEYIEGCNLDRLVKSDGRLPVNLAYAALRQTALALQYAHEQGVVHRDIKPGNILVMRSGDEGQHPHIKLVDFGLARLCPPERQDHNTLTVLAKGLGTPSYVAPEQAKNFHGADIRSDLYSLGCTFYFALTGQPPFPGASVIEIIAKQLEANPAPLEELRPDIPRGLATIIRKLMDKKPSRRYQTPLELLDALAYAVEHSRGNAVQAIEQSLSGGSSLARSQDDNDARLVDDNLRGATDQMQPALPALGIDEVKSAQPVAEPMTCAGTWDEAKDTDLAFYWRQWCAVLDKLLTEHKAALHAANYETLHRGLLRAIRSQPSEWCPSDIRQMDALAAPWVTAASLSGLDRQQLHHLRDECMRLGRGAVSSGGKTPWLALLVVVAAGAAALLAGLAIVWGKQ